MTSPRLAWPSAIRGAAIILVVLLHTTSTHYENLDWGPELLRDGWGLVSSFLAPIRIPAFFLISGWFVAKYVHQPMHLSARKRIAGPLYLYVLWVLIHGLVFAGLDPDSSRSIAGDPGLGVVLVMAETSLWYMLALAVFFTVGWATGRLPIWMVLTAAAFLSLVSLVPDEGTIGGLGWMAQNLVWYLAGARLPSRIRQLSQTTVGIPAVLGTWVGYVIASGLFLVQRKTELVVGTPGIVVEWVLLTVASAVGLFAILMMASRLTGGTRAGKALVAAGEDTITIYVLHVPIIALLHVAVAWIPMPNAIAAVWPLVATAFVCIAAYWLGQALRKIGGRWLFKLPERSMETDMEPLSR